MTDASAIVDVAVIGGGNMGAALVGGMIASGAFEPAQLAVVELVGTRRAELTERFPGVLVTSDVPRCRSAVVAVKPVDAPAAALAACEAGAARLLSIAAGVRISTLEAAIEPAGRAGSVAVVRSMPNTPALVGQGMSAIAGGVTATDDDVTWAGSILGAVGLVEVVDEEVLDAFTGVAGSGPAYVFLMAEALVDAAVNVGFDRAMATRVVSQLLVGSATLLARDGDPVGLRAQVTSPGGTTAAGIAALERGGLRDAVAAAVSAATTRSRELG